MLENDPEEVPLVGAAHRSPFWSLVFWDDYSLSYARNARNVEPPAYELIDPTDRESRYLLERSPAKLIPELTRAIAAAPDTCASAHNGMGIALGRLGRYEESLAHFLAALELAPDYREARENMAVSVQQMRQRQRP